MMSRSLFVRKTGSCRSTPPDPPLTPAPPAPPTLALAVELHHQRLGLCDCVGPRSTTFRSLLFHPGSRRSIRLSSPPERICLARCLQPPAETSYILRAPSVTSQEADGQSGGSVSLWTVEPAGEVEVGGRRETSCTTRVRRHKILEATQTSRVDSEHRELCGR